LYIEREKSKITAELYEEKRGFSTLFT
jgi:hypothetical protein